MKVYLAAPYADAGYMRIVADSLRSFGLTIVSRWHNNARGIEDFSKYLPQALAVEAEANDGDVADCDALLVVAREGAGGEMFAEARLALSLGKQVVWCGRRTLSAWRRGVTRVGPIDEGVTALVEMAIARAK